MSDRDNRPSTTETELRELIIKAWEDGWAQRGHYANKTPGTRIADKPRRLNDFLRAWDLHGPRCLERNGEG